MRTADLAVVARILVLVVTTVERQPKRQKVGEPERRRDIAAGPRERRSRSEQAAAIPVAIEVRDLDDTLRERLRGGDIEATWHRAIADRLHRRGAGAAIADFGGIRELPTRSGLCNR